MAWSLSKQGGVVYSCNMDTSGLLPSGNGCTYQADHKCPCYNYYVTLPKANSLNANMSTTTGFFIYARLKGPIMVMHQ